MGASDPQPYPSKYVMLDDNQGNLQPPPYRRIVPQYLSSHKKGSCRKWCLRCICCFYCFLFLIIFVMAAAVFFLYTLYEPLMPTYIIEKFEVLAFNVNHDMSFYSEFTVTLKADNSNQDISFIYGTGGSVVILFLDSPLSSGDFPAFRQPHNNVSMINVSLKGLSDFGSGLHEALMESQEKRKIPLVVQVTAPVSVVMGGVQLKEVVVRLDCSLVVNNLSPNKKIRILSSAYKLFFGIG